MKLYRSNVGSAKGQRSLKGSEIPSDQADRAAIEGEIGFALDSYDPATNSIEVVLTTFADVVRKSYDSEDWGQLYIERLSGLAEDLDLTFLRSGNAPWLDSHISWSLDRVLGAILKDSIVLEGQDLRESGGANTAKLRARVTLSRHPDDSKIVGNIIAGIIRGVSIGYTIMEWRVIPGVDGRLPIRIAKKWAIDEGSSVPLGADPEAGTRQKPAATGGKMKIKRNKGESDKDFAARLAALRAAGEDVEEDTTPDPEDEETKGKKVKTEDGDDAEARARAAVTAERGRVIAISQAARNLGFTADNADVAKMIEDGVTADQARAKLHEIASARGPAGKVNVQIQRDAGEVKFRAAEEAIMHRLAPTSHKMTELAATARGRDVLSIIAHAMGRSLDDTSRGEFADELFARAAVAYRGEGASSTSDFPILLQSIPDRMLRAEYAKKAPTYRAWSKQGRPFKDFRPQRTITASGTGLLEEVPEHGTLSRTTIAESKEDQFLKTYGRKMVITRKALINDDLGVFSTLPAKLAESASRTEDRLAYAALLGSTIMDDGVALFHSDHANLIASGTGAPSAAQLGKVRSALAKQLDVDGEGELELQLAILLVPDALLDTTEALLSDRYLPTASSGVVNRRYTGLTVVSSPKLDNVSTSAWYGFADPMLAAAFQYGYLDGQNGPAISKQVSFDDDGMALKIIHDFAFGAVDFRPVVKNNG